MRSTVPEERQGTFSVYDRVKDQERVPERRQTLQEG